MNDVPLAADDTLDPGRLQPVSRATPADYPDEALEAFVVEHYDRLLRLARLVCHDAVEAADAVQAGLEQAWRHRADLRDEDRQRAWLDRIVVREAIRVGRRRRIWLERILGIDHQVEDGPPAPHPVSSLAIRVVIDDAFRQLSPEQRAVIALHLHAGYTVA